MCFFIYEEVPCICFSASRMVLSKSLYHVSHARFKPDLRYIAGAGAPLYKAEKLSAVLTQLVARPEHSIAQCINTCV